jgi:2-haloacid dehalogenase
MTQRLSGIKACVFDAYGTLFDFNAAAARCRDWLGSRTDALSKLWREKQLQYTWLRSLMGRHCDFWQLTGEALDFAMRALSIEDAKTHERLMGLYKSSELYPDVRSVLERLRSARLKTAILSNGSPEMLSSAVEGTGIGHLLDAVLSIEDAGIYKPHASVYRLAADRFRLAPGDICFVSSNAWDAHGAAVFGFRVIWCNRAGQQQEVLPGLPEAIIRTLTEVPILLGL